MSLELLDPPESKPTDAGRLFDEAQRHANSGDLEEAFERGCEALLLQPGDLKILSFLATLKPSPKGFSESRPACLSQAGHQPAAFESLPFVRRVRELRQITGGSTGCGWMNDELALVLYTLVKWFKPELVIQTGHLWGKSAAMVLESLNDGFLTPSAPLECETQNADKYFTEFLKSNNPPAATEPKFYSVDPSPLEVPHPHEGVRHLKQLHPNFEFFPIKSTEFFQTHGERLRHEHAHQRVLGIVDGDHNYWGCLLDLEGFASLGTQMILVDDTMWLPHIGSAARAFASRNGYQFLNLTWYNGLGILFKKDSALSTCQRRPSGFSFRLALNHALYCLGGLRLMKLIPRPKTDV